jgi:hypothetical protein
LVVAAQTGIGTLDFTAGNVDTAVFQYQQEHPAGPWLIAIYGQYLAIK